jgi:hypothetical protein
MPRGPKGEKRPADVIGNAVHVMRIATGEIEETQEPKSPAAELGSKGGKARAEKMTPGRRAQSCDETLCSTIGRAFTRRCGGSEAGTTGDV